MLLRETSATQTLGATDIFDSGAPVKYCSPVKDLSTNKIIVVYKEMAAQCITVIGTV